MYRPRNPRASPLWQCARRHTKELREAGRLRRAVEVQVLERFLECGDPHHGFARIYCDACRHDYLLAYSCKTRYFCPSCHQKRALLAEGFRRAVLDFLVKNEALSDELPKRMLGWRHAGFSAHYEVRVTTKDAKGRKKLADYMLRAPMSLEKMSYDVATGTMIDRSKMHADLKQNFQVMSGAQWLGLLCRHIPDRYERLVRYVGWYSNRSRGVWAATIPAPATDSTLT